MNTINSTRSKIKYKFLIFYKNKNYLNYLAALRVNSSDFKLEFKKKFCFMFLVFNLSFFYSIVSTTHMKLNSINLIIDKLFRDRIE